MEIFWHNFDHTVFTLQVLLCSHSHTGSSLEVSLYSTCAIQCICPALPWPSLLLSQSLVMDGTQMSYQVIVDQVLLHVNPDMTWKPTTITNTDRMCKERSFYVPVNYYPSRKTQIFQQSLCQGTLKKSTNSLLS